MTAIDWQYYTIFMLLSREEKMRPWRENNDHMTQNRTREETNMMRICVSAIICKGSEGKQERRKARCRECRKIEREKEETKKRERGRERGRDKEKESKGRGDNLNNVGRCSRFELKMPLLLLCSYCCCSWWCSMAAMLYACCSYCSCCSSWTSSAASAAAWLRFVSFILLFFVFFLVYFEKSENANAISRGLIFLAEKKKQQTSQKSTSNMVKTQPACGCACVRVCVSIRYKHQAAVKWFDN